MYSFLEYYFDLYGNRRKKTEELDGLEDGYHFYN